MFNNDSDDSDEDQKPSKVGLLGPGETQKRQARLAQEKAIEEDPNIFQYDELYEDMDNKRKEEQIAKKKSQPQGPKYIKKLLETAEKRKKEYERRVERQVQKERDEEGEQFKDKESFVTSSYKKKLEEMQAAEEEEKRAEYLESIGDVQKQSNLDGFYRHLYAQKTGHSKETPSTANTSKAADPAKTEAASKKERHYRKRESGQDEEVVDEKSAVVTKDSEDATKTHIASNIDADSDFSIDSSDSEDDEEKNKKVEKKPLVDQEIKERPEGETFKVPESAEEKKPEEAKDKSPSKVDDKVEEDEEPAPKKVKIDIWAKRTVGDAFYEAVQRYFERKAARSGG